jgi:signal recognition particle subunit SRP54
MFEDLSEKLEATFARLRGRGVLSEADIKEGLREVRRVLLEADVNFQLTREFLERVEKKATGVNALSTVSPGQQLVKIVHEELTGMLGERREGLRLSTVPPSVVMMVGLQGSGKTTTAAKLARKLKAEGRSTRLVAADVYRPAAIDQLETLGRDLSIPVYADRTTTDVVKIARAGVAEALRERDRVGDRGEGQIARAGVDARVRAHPRLGAGRVGRGRLRELTVGEQADGEEAGRRRRCRVL